ncbi:MAG: hypothetical protein NC122_02605 [Faecalibacterium sp.]|nr:hypothetical protein [Ruminococcus sp.]MCM1391966.1 hypothetical protein [Ruminococcus sp.]MCM1485075.1 hypothetical protein [Faecalibacterium sp.]
MNKSTAPAPMDEEILAYERVPIAIAARYLGLTRPMLEYKMQSGNMPFGEAIKGKGR